MGYTRKFSTMRIFPNAHKNECFCAVFTYFFANTFSTKLWNCGHFCELMEFLRHFKIETEKNQNELHFLYFASCNFTDTMECYLLIKTESERVILHSFLLGKV